jgi:hypothetical protein
LCQWLLKLNVERTGPGEIIVASPIEEFGQQALARYFPTEDIDYFFGVTGRGTVSGAGGFGPFWNGAIPPRGQPLHLL